MQRVVDLTLTLRPGMRGVEFSPARTLAEHGWNATTLHLYSHCGTHMDAPVHYGVSEQGIDSIPPAACIGPAWVANLSGIAPKTWIEPKHLGDVTARVQPGDGLLLRTDWSARVGEPAYRDALPRVSDALAQWCVEHRVRMLGVESPAVADPHNREEITRVHRILLGGGVIIVEGLAHLDQLTQERVLFLALPLKWSGDGAPVRAMAIEGVPADLLHPSQAP